MDDDEDRRAGVTSKTVIWGLAYAIGMLLLLACAVLLWLDLRTTGTCL